MYSRKAKYLAGDIGALKRSLRRELPGINNAICVEQISNDTYEFWTRSGVAIILLVEMLVKHPDFTLL